MEEKMIHCKMCDEEKPADHFVCKRAAEWIEAKLAKKLSESDFVKTKIKELVKTTTDELLKELVGRFEDAMNAVADRYTRGSPMHRACQQILEEFKRGVQA